MPGTETSGESSRGRTTAERTSSTDLRNQTTVFCVLWAIGHIAHVLRKSNPTEPFVWFVIIAAVLLIERPASRLRLGALASVYLVYLWTKMPIIGNHAHMMGFVNLGILVALLTSWMRRSHHVRDEFELPLGYIKLTLLLSYGASAVAKLNTGFFNPEVSCAVGMCYKALAVFGIQHGSLPPSVEILLPYLIAGLELVIPVLLIVPRFRRIGIIVVVVFHLIMSLSPTATAIDFTLVLLALVFLFFPTTTATHVTETAERLRSVLPDLLLSQRAALFVLVSFLLAMALWSGKATVFENRNWIILAITVLIIAPLFLVFAIVAPSFRAVPVDHTGRVKPPLLRAILFDVFVVIQLANISAPYLGSKNLGTFTMYSNLRTEAGYSNHYLIPRLPLMMSQDDLVEIVESSNTGLTNIRQNGLLISWHELRRNLSAYPDSSITYRRDGILYIHQHAWENPELVTLDPIAHKFVGHRLYDPMSETCRH